MSSVSPVHRLLRRPRTAAVLAGYGVAAAALGVGAVVPSAIGFAAGAAGTYLLDAYMWRRQRGLDAVLRRLVLGVSVRFLLRETALLVFLHRSGVPSEQVAAVGATLWLLHALRGLAVGILIKVRGRRSMPVLTRNIDLSALAIPDAPSPLVRRDPTRRLLHLDVPLVAAGALAGFTGTVPALPLVVAGSAAASVGVTAYAAWHFLRVRHLTRDHVLATVLEEVRALRPEVLLYFSGSRSALYQVNMWLSTAEALEHRVLVLMRERANMPRLGRTSLPVLCMPSAVDLMNAEMPDARVALFVANVGKNIHLLRVPGVTSVFIGHGDSDKVASFNPFSKVYDEIWVAGQAGRERYARAQVGVRDEDIVEVGRPQLAPVRPALPRPPGWTPTVLYAPTWEGWTEDVANSGFTRMGPAIVRGLLDHEPPLRVLYRPHPLAGTRSPEARQAHAAIIAMINEANAAQAVAEEPTPEEEAAYAEATARLRELVEAMSQRSWAPRRSGADEAQTARDLGHPDREALAAAARAQEEYDEVFWATKPPSRHRVPRGSRPTLYGCFNQADVMIADISSVVADFLASGKPYVVTNPGGLPESEFTALNPSASAAYLLDPGGDVAEVLRPALGEDPLAERRRDLTTYLLGPDHHDALARFDGAVARLVQHGRAAAAPGFGVEPEVGEDLGEPLEDPARSDGHAQAAGEDGRDPAPEEDAPVAEDELDDSRV